MANKKLRQRGLILANALSATFLYVAQNKFSEVIKLTPVESIALVLAAFFFNAYVVTRMMVIDDDSAVIERKKTGFSAQTLRLTPRIGFSIILGIGSFLGGLIWFLSGVVGFYAVLPLLLVLLALVLKTSFVRDSNNGLGAALSWSALFCFSTYALYLCASLLLIIHQGGARKNGVVMIPLMLEPVGLLLAAVAGGIGAAIGFAIYRPGNSES
jgi:hypothetical protein